MSTTDEAELFRICRGQAGLITLDQLHNLGWERHHILRHVQAGWLVRADNRVFRVPAIEPTWRQRSLALRLAAGPHALIGRRSAARAWELERATWSTPEVVVPRWDRRHVKSGVVVESTDLLPSDAALIDGLDVTTVERTLIDCAAVLHPAQLARSADDAVRRGLTSYERTFDRFIRLARRGRPGTVRMRSLLDERLGLGLASGNAFESLLLRAIRRQGLPEPVAQLLVEVGGGRYYLDFAWLEQRVCVDCDGWETHGTPVALAADLRRQNDLVLAGWTILRFAWRTLVDDPAGVVAQIALALGV